MENAVATNENMELPLENAVATNENMGLPLENAITTNENIELPSDRIVELEDTVAAADPESSSDSSNSDVISISDSDAESDSNESTASVEIIEGTVDVIDLENNDVSIISIKSDSTKVDLKTNIVHFDLDTTPDFIPVENYSNRIKFGRGGRLRAKRANNIVMKPVSSETVPKRKKRKRANDNQTFQKSYHPKIPTRIIQLNYPNIMNDSVVETPSNGFRPVIIDGCNVGFSYGNGNFVMHGNILVIKYFKSRGHEEIVCFLPQRFRHRTRSPSEERTVEGFEKENIFSFTPSRHLENGKRYTPYDDRFILQYAAERQGVIISNDGYRDLIEEDPSWRETIEKRIINYTFARGLFMLPKDPLGPSGPTLDEMLKFP